MKRKKLLFLIPLGILAVLLFIALGGWIVQQLWNWLMPLLFGLRLVTFWQGLGILALCRILFGGFGMHGSQGPRRHKGYRAWTPRSRSASATCAPMALRQARARHSRAVDQRP